MRFFRVSDGQPNIIQVSRRDYEGLRTHFDKDYKMTNVKQEQFNVDDPEFEASLSRVNHETAKFKQQLNKLSKKDLIRMNVGFFTEIIRLSAMLQKQSEGKNETINEGSSSVGNVVSTVDSRSASESKS